ncbi:hypothetical protein ABI59_14740 [Acidobacteria bacterium Mor1]|nr:hypothetical protein ABI59_14740 [Acidobacteria bacterium Mor1]
MQSLSRGSAESINKGYLSRSENGRQSISFTKVITLCRIYSVPSEVFFERMELDMELDRVGGPDTEGKSLDELLALARDSIQTGAVWNAYAYHRDSVALAARYPVVGRFNSVDEQLLVCLMYTCSSAMKLGRLRYPMHEFEYIEDRGILSEKFDYIVADRMAKALRELGKYESAKNYAMRAIAGAERTNAEFLHAAYANRGRIAYEEGDVESAIDFYMKAYRATTSEKDAPSRAIHLLCLGETYLMAGRTAAARRASEAVERIARELNNERSLAFAFILRGNVESADERHDAANRAWRAAAEIGKRNSDRLLRFKAELLLYEQALQLEHLAPARAIERRLRRLAPWVPPELEELHQFERLAATRSVRPN